MSGDLMTIKQLEARLQLSERTIFRLIQKGELQAFKVGREWRIQESDVDDFISRQKAKVQPKQEDTKEVA